MLGQGCRIGRHEWHHLDIARSSRIDRGGGTAGYAGNIRLKGAHPQHLTGLVRGTGDHWHTLWYTGHLGCISRDRAQWLSYCGEGGQHIALDGHAVPFPIGIGAPILFFKIKGHVPHLTAGAVFEFTGQSVIQITRKQQKVCGFCQQLGLMPLQPVGFGLCLKILDNRPDAEQRKEHSPDPRQPSARRGSALVCPDDGGPQRSPHLIEVDYRGTLCRDHDRRDLRGVDS